MAQTQKDSPSVDQLERSNALMSRALGTFEGECRTLRLALAAAQDGLRYGARQLRLAQRHREAERVEEFIAAAERAIARKGDR